MPLTFGLARLCRRCAGAGRLTRSGRPMGDALAAAINGTGPVEIDGRLVAYPAPNVREQLRLDALERTHECPRCKGSGLEPAEGTPDDDA